jgi:hypothetical protein
MSEGAHLRTQVRVLTLGFSLVFTMLNSGCGGNGSNSPGPITTPNSSTLQGRTLGGQFPVKGAQVQLYAAGSTGYGAGASALLSPALTTDSNGGFSFTSSNYTCPSPSTPTYLVATGGDPGLGSDNPSIALMTALGPCSQVSSISFVVVNEVTTVASAWSLNQFLGSGAQIGTSSGNVVGLVNAFANVNNLVDISKGTSPGTSAPVGAAVPTTKLYTLANILASCVNSTGSTACNALFSAARPPAGTAPTNTLDAALAIARNPANNVATLSALSTPQAPFGPALSASPNDWTLAVSFSGGGLDLPTAIAVDASGNVWAANYCGSNSACSSATKLSGNGQPSSSTGFSDGTFFENYGLGIDPKGNVWLTNYNSVQVNSGHGSIAELNATGQVLSPIDGYSGGGINFPAAVAADTDGSIWIANQGNSTASKISNSGSPLSGSGWGSGQLWGPSAVAIDANHNAWFANQNAASGSVTSVSPDGLTVKVFPSGGNQPSGIATDAIGISTNTSKGHVWVANYTTSSVSELRLNNDGSVTVVGTYTGGGIDHPNGIAVDGSGNVWVTNYRIGPSLSEFQGANSSSPGQPLSPAAGLGADANLVDPFGVAIDASGNVWVSNSGASYVTQFLGAATPVKTPLVGPPQLP